jgi:hypothetical protein
MKALTLIVVAFCTVGLLLCIDHSAPAKVSCIQEAPNSVQVKQTGLQRFLQIDKQYESKGCK